METIKETRGRKPLPTGEKKIPLTIYVRTSDINTIGSKAEIKNKLLDYINTMKYVKDKHGRILS